MSTLASLGHSLDDLHRFGEDGLLGSTIPCLAHSRVARLISGAVHMIRREFGVEHLLTWISVALGHNLRRSASGVAAISRSLAMVR